MNNMRRGFTMIELIFVIVIIGILAAVAIPKLTATRDDAKISSLVANTRTVVEDVKNYYVAQGKTNWTTATVSTVTDVPLFTDTACTTQADGDVFDGTTLYMCGDDADVVQIDSNDTHITVADGSDTTSPIAVGVQNDKVFKALRKATRLGGQAVKR